MMESNWVSNETIFIIILDIPFPLLDEHVRNGSIVSAVTNNSILLFTISLTLYEEVEMVTIYLVILKSFFSWLTFNSGKHVSKIFLFFSSRSLPEKIKNEGNIYILAASMVNAIHT